MAAILEFGRVWREIWEGVAVSGRGGGGGGNGQITFGNHLF